MRRARAVCLGLLVLAAPVAAADAPWGFGDFLGPVRIPHVSAETCEACHTEQHTAWNQSHHRASFDNPLFLEGFATEPHARCVYCHAPSEEQSRALLRGRRRVVRERSLASVPRESLAHEGITCATCHLREGAVLSPHAGGVSDAHPVRHEPRLREASFCAGCHEFLGHDVVDGRTVLNDERLQTTFSEWSAWRAGGGTRTCQQCHMPDKAHSFRGAYDVDYLHGALSLRVERERGRWVAVVESRGVGHAFPTGDVFRHLVLWADDTSVARFGQTFALTPTEAGEVTLKRTANTSLQPGVPVRVPLPKGTRRVRVTYHYARGDTPSVELATERVP